MPEGEYGQNSPEESAIRADMADTAGSRWYIVGEDNEMRCSISQYLWYYSTLLVVYQVIKRNPAILLVTYGYAAAMCYTPLLLLLPPESITIPRQRAYFVPREWSSRQRRRQDYKCKWHQPGSRLRLLSLLTAPSRVTSRRHRETLNIATFGGFRIKNKLIHCSTRGVEITL